MTQTQKTLPSITPSITFFQVDGYPHQYIFPMGSDVRYDGCFDQMKFAKIPPVWNSPWDQPPVVNEPINTPQLAQRMISRSMRWKPIKADIDGGWGVRRLAFELVIPVRETIHATSHLIIFGYTNPAKAIAGDLVLHPTRIMQVTTCMMASQDGYSTLTSITHDDQIVGQGLSETVLKSHRPEDAFSKLEHHDISAMAGFHSGEFLDLRSTIKNRKLAMSATVNDAPEEYMRRCCLAWHAASVENDLSPMHTSEMDIIRDARNLPRETTMMNIDVFRVLSGDTDFCVDGSFTLDQFVSLFTRFAQVEPKLVRAHGAWCPVGDDGDSHAFRIVSKVVDVVNAMTMYSGVMSIKLIINDIDVAVVFNDADLIEGFDPDPNFVDRVQRQISNVMRAFIDEFSMMSVDMSINIDLRTEAYAMVIFDGQRPEIVRRPMFASAMLSPILGE